MENPLDTIYEYVEQTYLRQQFGDVLIRCLEKGDIEPMQKIVEELILTQPHSLRLLRHIITETNTQRAHIEDKLHQLLVLLQGEWKNHGIQAAQFQQIILYSMLPAEICLEMLGLEGIDEEKAKLIYTTTIKKNRRQMSDLSVQLRMIKEIEDYLQDWLWGMAYEAFHREYPNDPTRKQIDRPAL